MEGNATDCFDDHNSLERRFLRSSYLSVRHLIRDKRDEITDSTSEKFLSIINEVDEMHHRVKKPREQASDAETLQDLASALLTSIKVHSTGSVTPSVFVSGLISEYGRRERLGITRTHILWKEIGFLASALFMNCNGSCTMLGPMRHETKPPKVSDKRKRRRTTIKEEKVKPEELEDTATSKEETGFEETIATMFDILKWNTIVCVENLILNRKSFAQTVENLFALSFLVKNGRVVITVDKKGFHHVSPRNAPASSLIMSRKAVFCHFIFRLEFIDWKLMKGLVAEGSELMPHRIKTDY